MSKAEILNEIQTLVPPGSGEPREPEVLDRLTTLTGSLIDTYDAAGELNRHPFSDIENRSIHLCGRRCCRCFAEPKLWEVRLQGLRNS